MLATLASAAVARAEPGTKPFRFFGGFNAAAYCDGSGIIPSPMTLPAPYAGFAIIRAPSSLELEATVSIRGYALTYYTVRLIQGADDCQTVDWEGLTNGAGMATIHLSEPVVSSTAFIAIDQYSTFEGVPFEINWSFVTETYRH